LNLCEFFNSSRAFRLLMPMFTRSAAHLPELGKAHVAAVSEVKMPLLVEQE
jgi:hypothetical protein